jgi:hypothetical protein
MPPWGLADEPPAAATPPTCADHLGRGSGFVDEHQAFRIKVRLAGLPALPGLGHVGPLLLGRVQSFF